MKTRLISPHGNSLKPRLVEGAEREEMLKKAACLPKLSMSSKEVSDLIMMAIGAFSPLEGFMTKKDYRGVVENMQLEDGTLWPIPVTLAVSSKDRIDVGQKVALIDQESNSIMGIMQIEEIFPYDKHKEAESVFLTTDEAHPGVKKLYEQGDFYVGGKVCALSCGRYPDLYPEFATCKETRKIFAEHDWSTITAFQTRNPMHRSHEYLIKIAMEISDGVFIHPIVGKLKPGDIPADVRMQCYHAVLDKYYPKERVVLRVYPMEMRYGGPKEAVLHAIIRQNFGCTHLIIGRDHAGVGSFYGSFDAQNIFDTLPEGSLHIKPLKLDWSFWCCKCGEMASLKTCPHPKEDHKMISGTKLREMLSSGEYPPDYITRAEVSDILIDYYKSLEET